MGVENPRRGLRTRILTEFSLVLLISYLNTLRIWGESDNEPFRFNPRFKPTLERILQFKQRCGPKGPSLLDPGEEFRQAQEDLIAIMPRGDLQRLDPEEALRRVMKKVNTYVKKMGKRKTESDGDSEGTGT